MLRGGGPENCWIVRATNGQFIAANKVKTPHQYSLPPLSPSLNAWIQQLQAIAHQLKTRPTMSTLSTHKLLWGPPLKQNEEKVNIVDPPPTIESCFFRKKNKFECTVCKKKYSRGFQLHNGETKRGKAVNVFCMCVCVCIKKSSINYEGQL